MEDAMSDHEDYEREYRAIKEVHGNKGYLEGIEAGKEETLQAGFDLGYSEGSELGFLLGTLRGILRYCTYFHPLNYHVIPRAFSVLQASELNKTGNISPEKLLSIAKLEKEIQELSEFELLTHLKSKSIETSCGSTSCCKGNTEPSACQPTSSGQLDVSGFKAKVATFMKDLGFSEDLLQSILSKNSHA
eukprot:Colp12_sorted_trinity150504_noHs@105